MKQVFDMIDADKDGKISRDDYKNMLSALQKDDLIEAVPEIFKKVDLNGDGFIDFKDFMEWHKKGGGVKSLDLHIAFRLFDLKGNGTICAEDVCRVLGKLGEGCNLEDCRRMVRAVDTDGDGLINEYDFKTMMTRSMKRV